MSFAVTVQQEEPRSSAARLIAPESERRLPSGKRKYSDTRQGHHVHVSKSLGKGGREQSWKRTIGEQGAQPAVERPFAGRNGRQFTVGNVGNNGMMYLRSVSSVTLSPLSLGSFYAA